jgi:hypothetical protein
MHLEGKDYSNPRVADFHTLNKPEEDLHDRTKIPRMPWYRYPSSDFAVFLSSRSQARRWFASCWTTCPRFGTSLRGKVPFPAHTFNVYNLKFLKMELLVAYQGP